MNATVLALTGFIGWFVVLLLSIGGLRIVATVKGEASFEQETLTKVVEARAKATSMQVTPATLNDPQAFAKFQQAQGELSGALSRLMVVAERYPTRSVQPDGDGWLIEVTVASERWLRDLLLRLGSEAEVVRPAEWVGLGAAAASELLRRYERAGSDGS